MKDRLWQIINEKEGGKHTVFARKAGIPPSTFQNYIEGRYPHAEHLIHIYETYNVNIHWLLTGIGEPYIKDDRITDSDCVMFLIIEAMRESGIQLTAEGLSKIMKLVQDEAWVGMKKTIVDVLKSLTKAMPRWKEEDLSGGKDQEVS